MEGVYISNINMANIKTRAISFDLYYGGLSVSEMRAKTSGISPDDVVPVSEETPQFNDICIRDVTCKGAQQAIYLQGLPEMMLKNVNLSNMRMEAESGLLAMDAEGVQVDTLTLMTRTSPAITLYNARNVSMANLVLPESDSNLISINGEKSKDIAITVSSRQPIKDRYMAGKEVNAPDIQIDWNSLR